VWSSSFHGIVCDSQGWDAVWCFSVQFSSLGFVVFTVDIQFSSFSRALKRKIRRFLRRRRAVGGGCGEGRDEHQWSKHLRKSIGRR
jgi:hypothetical protein